jgi:hypothetical protein
MNAHARHIAKYVDHYRIKYPSSAILLVTSSYEDFFFHTTKRQKLELAPAVRTIRTYITDGRGLLVHALSNGGAGHVALISKLYMEQTGYSFPVDAIILDSTPGKARLRQGTSTFAHGLPSSWYIIWPAKFFFAILLALFYLLPQLLGYQTLAETMWRNLNSLKPAYLNLQVKRCYIYSDGDAFIPASDVEEHSAEAESKGFKVVERVYFKGTPHVAHMRYDPTRYWSAVERTWQLSQHA